MKKQMYYVTGRLNITGERVKLTPACSKEMAERALFRAQRYNLKEAAFRDLRVEREDGVQLSLEFGTAGAAARAMGAAAARRKAGTGRATDTGTGTGERTGGGWAVYAAVSGNVFNRLFTGTLAKCNEYARRNGLRDALVIETSCTEAETERRVELLFFMKGDREATIATDGLRSVTQENMATGPLTKDFATLPRAIAYLEARGYSIDASRFQAL